MAASENESREDRSYEQLLENNRAWVAQQLRIDPDYFDKLAHSQSPKFFWVGCADSRVPANVITGMPPGEVFVHRNIANIVVNTDLNCMSVLQYAVEVLEVEHVIVCGHYGCGGVTAALSENSYGLIDHWLRSIKDVYRTYRAELRAYSDPKAVERRLVELNVIESVYNLSKTSILQRAWKDHGGPRIHGWVYDISDGLIRDLGVNFSNPEMLDAIYHYKL
jgi:carbonic anhydrase